MSSAATLDVLRDCSHRLERLTSSSTPAASNHNDDGAYVFDCLWIPRRTVRVLTPNICEIVTLFHWIHVFTSRYRCRLCIPTDKLHQQALSPRPANREENREARGFFSQSDSGVLFVVTLGKCATKTNLKDAIDKYLLAALHAERESLHLKLWVMGRPRNSHVALGSVHLDVCRGSDQIDSK